ncbi:MAG: hypothetical protein K0U38_03190 [Epsilonproteobacteria bacterium]|nr:hypothetical protein [Campylobacterota bacterium]
MKHNLNNRFTLSSDKYNWILLDEQEGKKVKRSYFPNIKQLSRFMGELVAKESQGKAKVDLGDIRTITPSYSSVIDKIVERLEAYIDTIVQDEKSRCRK